MEQLPSPPTFFERLNQWARRSVSLKLLTIGFLILVLLIPSALLTSLISEREQLRDQATREVSAMWGGEQTIGGPVLTIPYRQVTQNDQGVSQTFTRYAHFLPDRLDVTGDIRPEKRYRGIYVVVLYNTNLRVTGNFPAPRLSELQIPLADYLFDKAFLSVGISDMKGIRDNINVRLNDTTAAFAPGIASGDLFQSGVSLPVVVKPGQGYKFDFALNLNGSTTLSFLPFGKETTVSLTSPWDNPKFEGAFATDTNSVSSKGFTARWKVLQLNRNYGQQGLGNFVGDSPAADRDQERYDGMAVASGAGATGASDFGVRLRLPIDEYQKTMRAAKYNLVFIILTFLAFFFVEVLNRQRVHPIQYLLVGFAVSLFYLLLLSLSEQIAFDAAYWVSCVIILTLITFYAGSILRNRRLTALVSGMLLLLYGFFYALLQLQDYALLMGSLGLLLILATIMTLTRHLDWYNVQADRAE